MESSGDEKEKKRDWKEKPSKDAKTSSKDSWVSTKGVSNLPSNGFASKKKANSLGEIQILQSVV